LSESRKTCPPCSTAIGASMRKIEPSHPIVSCLCRVRDVTAVCQQIRNVY
jgi:hypothetical protein